MLHLDGFFEVRCLNKKKVKVRCKKKSKNRMLLKKVVVVHFRAFVTCHDAIQYLLLF